MPKKTTKNTKAKKVTPKKATKKAATKKVATKKATTKKNTVKKTAAKKSSSKATTIKKYEEAQFLASIKPYALKKNEKYMNAKQKQHFLSILDSWAEQLQIEQNRTADKIQENVTNFPDESDRATHEEEFTLELRTREEKESYFQRSMNQ